MSAHPHDPQADVDLDNFLSSINTDRLCAAASALRAGVTCSLGGKIVGGPREDFWYGNRSTGRTSIPVPEVFACRSSSDEENDVGAAYMLMERIPGRTLSDLQDVDVGSDDEEYEPTRAAAEKVFRQLAGFIMQLASLQFDKIGSFQEQPVGFCVGEYFDAGIVYPPKRGHLYEASSSKGPFSTVSEYHSAIMSLNENFAAVNEEDEDGDYFRSVRQCRLIQPKIALPQYEKGPFVLHHDDLSSSNILVDDDYNITGILDFPGTVVPLPTLCVYPLIVTENHSSPFTDQKLWLLCILNAQPVPGSAVNDPEARRLLMDGALGRSTFDTALAHAYTSRYRVIGGEAEHREPRMRLEVG